MKAWTIAVKDTLVRFRDRNAILLMLAAPLLISFIMGAAFGGQSGDASPISEIPLIIVNNDEGELGKDFAAIIEDIEVNTTDGAKGLFSITAMDDKTAAIEEVEIGNFRGAIHIPNNFSDTLTAGAEGETVSNVTIEVFTDPTANVSPGIIRGVVNRIANGFSTVIIGNQVAIDKVLDHTTDIPVVIVNSDPGPLGGTFAGIFDPDNFDGLLVITKLDDLETAQSMLDAGDAAAIINITEGFSNAVMAGAEGESVAATVEVTGASGSLSAPIVEELARDVARSFGSDYQPPTEPASPYVLANLDNLGDIIQAENNSFGKTEGTRDRISLGSNSIGESEDVNVLNYFVPSMSIFFLMFAVFDGTRSILEEERDGTLNRLMSTPTGKTQILLGKIGGTFLTGILQFIVLVAVSRLVFGVNWGNAPVAIALMVLATVAAATSLGAFVASFARNVNQAGALGTAFTLIFAILGGNFIDFRAYTGGLEILSKLTINRWALEGFVDLTLGGQGLSGVMLNIIVLFGIGAVFFTLAVTLFNRRFVK